MDADTQGKLRDLASELDTVVFILEGRDDEAFVVRLLTDIQESLDRLAEGM
jgi:hypothetical protein